MGKTSQRDAAWARWGWLFGAIWLGFFAFPLLFIWGGDRALLWQLGSTAVIAGFIVGYVVTVRRTTHQVVDGDFAAAQRDGLIGLAALLLLAVVLALLIGPNALTALPFVVSMSVFFLPWRLIWFTSIPIFVVGLVASALTWGVWPSGMYWGISLLVLAISVLSRYLEEQQEAATETEGQLALTAERERVARDVHDVLGHSLTVVTIKTELARRLVDADPERAKEELAQIQDLTRQALAEIRATVGGLRVVRLAEEVDSARMALEDAGIAAELPVNLTVVDPRHRITLAWVLREAVTNVIRHSQAGVCAVELGESTLQVRDDGRGVGDQGEGNGIRGLRERVEQAGGRLEIGPGPDGVGTLLEVKL